MWHSKEKDSLQINFIKAVPEGYSYYVTLTWCLNNVVDQVLVILTHIETLKLVHRGARYDDFCKSPELCFSSLLGVFSMKIVLNRF